MFSTPMEMQPQLVPSTPEEKLAKAPITLERECGNGLRLVKSWIQTGKIKDKGKGNIGRPSPSLATTLLDRGMQDVPPLRSTNVSRDLYEAGRERQAESPVEALQSTGEAIPPETGVNLPHDMGVGPNMGVNVTVFG